MWCILFRAVQETWVWSLCREEPLEKEMANHCSILAWKIPWTEDPGGAAVRGVTELGMTEQLTDFCFLVSSESSTSLIFVFY